MRPRLVASLVVAVVSLTGTTAAVDLTGRSRASATALQPSARSAAAALANLKVHSLATMTGYSRAQFGPAWTDDNADPDGHNGCDTRDDILKRDLTASRLEAGSSCVVGKGTLVSPYTGATIHFVRGVGTSNVVQIDHVVALGDAWTTGAAGWTAAKRVNLANDPLNLLAVDEHSNESKGDQDVAAWLPPRTSYDCAYVARQIAVKAKYKLWIRPAEKTAMTAVLHACPAQRIPSETTKTRVGAGGGSSASGGGSNGSNGGGAANHPRHIRYIDFQNCTEMNTHGYPHGVGRKGARDHTSSGDPVTTFYVNTRLYKLNASHDADHDGTACEKH